jgi:hypothetical protein
VASAIDVIVLTTRFSDGGRGLTEIAEVLPLDAEGHYHVQKMFEHRISEGGGDVKTAGALLPTGKISAFAYEPKVRILREHWGKAAEMFDVDKEK